MIKKVGIAVLLLLFIIFSSLIRYNDVSKFDIVSGIAIDFDGERWSTVCEVCLPSSTNDFGSRAEYVKGTGFTLADALYNAGLKSTNILFTESSQLYVIGDKALQKSEELERFFTNSEANLRAVAVISKKSAEQILQTEKEANSRAKSLSLAEKLKSFCKENGYDMPYVMNFIKNGGSICISEDGLAERREVA